MKAYLLSLAVGALVGIIYGALGVKSPAPPVVALVGLFGMLGGEQVVKRFHDWHSSPPSAHVSSTVEVGPSQSTGQSAKAQP